MKFMIGVIAQGGVVSAVWSEIAESKIGVWRKMIKDDITHLPEGNEKLKMAYTEIRAIEDPSDDEIQTFIAKVEDSEGYDISVWDLTHDADNYAKALEEFAATQ